MEILSRSKKIERYDIESTDFSELERKKIAVELMFGELISELWMNIDY